MPRKWHREFKEFMKFSKRRWKQLYPQFRKHSDGDKVIAYELVQKHVNVPKQYLSLDSVKKLTPEMIKNLPTDQFVIKAVLGNQGKRVLCIQKEHGKTLYRDIQRSNVMDLKKLMIYIKKTMNRGAQLKGTALIIEEFLGDPEIGLPCDYKIYTVYKKVKLITIFHKRGEKDEYATSFDADWNHIPIKDIYKFPKEVGYIEKSLELEPLPSIEIRKKLLELAETLANEHQAIFCRYDFYIISGQIYFGEITPVCGDLTTYALLRPALEILFPQSVRKKFRNKQVTL